MNDGRGAGLGWLRGATGGLLLARFSGRRSLIVSGIVLLILALVALLAPMLGRYNPNATVGPSLQGMSSAHFLGTDEFGRDIWSRILFGMRNSIVIALATAVVAGVLGSAAGLYGGYVGGARDSIIMRIADFLLGFPALVAAMIVVAVFGASKTSPTVAAILITTPLFARVVRGAVLSERNKEYVLATRALGAGTARLLARTLLPTVVPLILVQAAVAAALAVQLEAGLSFLGMGVPKPEASLGSMLFSAKGFLYQSPGYAIFPGVAITIVIGALIVFSNALEGHELVNEAALKRRAAEQ